MKGWPLFRSFLTLLMLLLAGLPLRSLTRTRIEDATPLAVVLPTNENLTISLTFTKPPTSYSLKYLGQEILQSSESDPASFDASTSLSAHYPAEGIDLVFEGKWSDRYEKVGVSMKVTRADGSQQTQTIWGKKDLFELLTFDGKVAR